MTLVIGSEVPGGVIMAADSAAGRPEEFYVYRHLEKIARRGPYLIGHCGNARIGQVLNHLVEWPEPPSSGPLAPFLIREVMPAIRRAVQDAGAAQEGRAILGETTVVLVAVGSELYIVGNDLTVVRSEGLACIGSGRHAAYPTMEALETAGVEPVRKRIEMALDIVARRVAVVEPPFRFLTLPAERNDGSCAEVTRSRPHPSADGQQNPGEVCLSNKAHRGIQHGVVPTPTELSDP